MVHTANFREWRHIFKLRCAKSAHWEIQRIMRILLAECTHLWPPVFEDLRHLLGEEGEKRIFALQEEAVRFGTTPLRKEFI